MRELPYNPVEMDNILRYRFGLPVRKRARTIPYGYKDRGDGWLEPDEGVYAALQQARAYLEDCSQRNVLEWLQAKTGIPINLSAFQKLMRTRLPFKEADRKTRAEREQLYHALTTTGQKTQAEDPFLENK